ncbi:SBBP repeat-containing protein [Laspinema olomoucense]|uniref:SBBP repeat-containing protein n=1 Tax=Laspinema olomoucense TaxID=3231600 RepID=UPI0021BB6A64|nr:SBBP repeat-containing protein [Laspinema sp. D3a]MCT7989335.1 SBBP repeat-containing protein [Laspinema sp. D3a]
MSSDLGLLINNYRYTDSAIALDPEDTYHFQLGGGGSWRLGVTGLENAVDLVLRNAEGTILRTSTLTDAAGALTLNDLLPGDYSLQVLRGDRDTPYTLTLDPITGSPLESGYGVTKDTEVKVEIADADKGDREIGLFSLNGMEQFAPDSPAYYQEAARRVLSNSHLGQLLVSQASQLSPVSDSFSWESNLNGELEGVEYRTSQTLLMEAGDKFGLMMVPKGTIQEVLDNPNKLNGNNRPVFSLDTNAGGGFQFRQQETDAGTLFTIDKDGNPNDIVIYIDKDTEDAIAPQPLAPEEPETTPVAEEPTPVTEEKNQLTPTPPAENPAIATPENNNIPPKELDFGIETDTFGKPITIAGSVSDRNGFTDIQRVEFLLQTQGEGWTAIGSVTNFAVNASEDTVANFTYQWTEGLAAGDYKVKAIAYDLAGKSSNVVVENFTVVDEEETLNKPTPQGPPEDKPTLPPQAIDKVPDRNPLIVSTPTEPTLPSELPNSIPGDLLFNILPLYINGESLNFNNAKIYDADGTADLNRVEFSLQKSDGEWIYLGEVTEFTTDSNGMSRFNFSYDLSDLEPGSYELRAVGYDHEGTETNVASDRFAIISDPGDGEFSDELRIAIANAADLEQYEPAQLAKTREWLVWLTPGESSADLAALAGAISQEAGEHISNTYIWEFPETLTPEEVAQKLQQIAGVEFATPQVPVQFELLDEPQNEPLVQTPEVFDILYPVLNKEDTLLHEFLNSYQWHLRSGVNPGADANITDAWDLAKGSGVVIGVVDDGIDYTHPDLRDRYLAHLSTDFNQDDSDPSPFYNKLIAAEKLPADIKDFYTTGFHLDVPLTGVVTDLNVQLNLLYPSLNQLGALLFASAKPTLDPLQRFYYFSSNRRIGGGNGSQPPPVELFGSNDLNGKDLAQTIFDQDGNYLSIINGKSPYTGIFKPTGNLDDFNQQWAGGLWNLQLRDNKGKKGELLKLGLDFQTYNPHGTAVAGLALATGDNGFGGSGVAPNAYLAGLRLIADEVEGDKIAKALSYENQEIDIYNNSWKAKDWLWKSPETVAAMAQSSKVGRGGLGNAFVFAGGNDGSALGDVNYNGFANSRYAIAVAAIDHIGKNAFYSEPGSPLLVSAYSSGNKVGMTTTDMVESNYGYSAGDYTNNFGGTSAAAPIVSGIIGLMLEVNPNLTWRDIQHILVETAQKNDPTDFEWTQNQAGYWVNYKYGFGAVDAEAATQLAANWTSVVPETKVSSALENVLEIMGEEEISSTLTIEEDITLEKVEVLFNAKHKDWGDLNVVLVSPDGTESVLSDIHEPNQLEENTYQPANNDKVGFTNSWTFVSNRHWGESSKGDWTLKVTDDDGNDVEGEWNSWKLNLYGTKPTVSVTATDAIASEDGDPGQAIVSRTGNLKHDLVVDLALNGTATAGVDYTAAMNNTPILPGVTSSIVIPAGQESIAIDMSAIDDLDSEENETVAFTLAENAAYTVGTEGVGTVTIEDNDLTQLFTDAGLSIPGVEHGSVDWGDYDSDGDLDLVLMGWDGSARGIRVYQNNGGSFTDIGASASFIDAFGTATWGDYDNDRDLDLLVVGWNGTWAGTKVYRNDNANFSEVVNLDAGGLDGAADWGDYNNDGDLDIAVVGELGNTKIYENTDGNFTEIATMAVGNRGASVAWGDADNDGDLDLLVAGRLNSLGATALYRNEGNNIFTDSGATLTGVSNGSVAWGDYDSDGDLDIALTGLSGSTGWGDVTGDGFPDIDAPGSALVTKLYQNDGSGNFAETASLEGLWDSSVAWGDYDNDGDLDLLSTGSFKAKVYNNNNGSFTDIGADFKGAYNASNRSSAWGDYDKDGDLDLFITGREAPGTPINRLAKLYENNLSTANINPTAPSNLNAAIATDAVTLSWNPATDAETPQTGLSYNLRIGTTPGGLEIMSPMSLSEGSRQVAQLGNINQNTTWTVPDLEPGTYYWSVQAVDSAFAGSEFATEGSFTIEPTSEQPLEWIRQFGTDRDDFSLGVAVDSDGNTYVTGQTYGSLANPQAGEGDIFVTKYDRAGNQVWTQQLGTSGEDFSFDIALDSNNNLYLAGYTKGTLGNANVGGDDALLAKYDRDGNLQWTRQFGTPNDDKFRSLSIDDADNIYISGYTQGALVTSNGNWDAFVTKYDTSGNQLWLEQFGTINSDQAWGSTADSAGNVYVTGYTTGSLGSSNSGSRDMFLTKYDTNGSLLWNQQLGTSASEQAMGVATDSAGNVYITGYTNGSLGGTNVGENDVVISKYDSNSNLMWTRQLGTTATEEARDIAVDNAGFIYVTGVTSGSLDGTNAGVQDIFVSKYDANGNQIWIRQLGTNLADFSDGMTVDSAGYIYLTGPTNGSLANTHAGGWGDVWVGKFK